MAKRASPLQSNEPGILIYLGGLLPGDHVEGVAPWQDASFLPMGALACAVPGPDEFEQRYGQETWVPPCISHKRGLDETWRNALQVTFTIDRARGNRR